MVVKQKKQNFKKFHKLVYKKIVFSYNSFIKSNLKEFKMQVQATQTEVQVSKAKAAYLVQREARTRFTFGKVWNQAVVEGTVTDKQKLVAHAVKLKAGRKYDLNKLKFETLLQKVQKALAV